MGRSHGVVSLEAPQRLVAALAGLCLLTALLVGPPALASAVEVGYEDHSYAGTTAPTGQKPQSKLWVNDGRWWGVLWNPDAKDFHIYRFDKANQTWVDTGTKADTRANSSADALWDGTKLYIASASSSASSSAAGKVWRYSYDAGAKRYTLDAGFPKTITSRGMEVLSVDKDRTGTLWATYTQGNKVFVTHTTTSDTTWLTPYELPVPGAANLTSDDLSAVVAFGSAIGVMWSNQNDSAMYFAVHADGAGDGAADWQRETAYSQPGGADDHISLRHLEGDPAGEVFAATKTSLNAPNDPLILVLVRKPSSGWEAHVFGTVADNHTRAILALDTTSREVYVFAAAPCCSGGAVYMKKSGFDAVSFAPGLGTLFIQSSANPKVNNPTSTKQNVTADTGLLVAAGDDSTRRYLHNFLALGTPAPSPPDTIIDAGPSGTVNTSSATFAFSSSPAGATFACDLDGSGFTACSSPQEYSGLADGSHTFQVRATNANGTDATPASRTWTIQTGAPLFADGFESGDFSAWTTVLTGGDGAATVQSGTVAAGAFAAQLSATTSSGSFAYARTALTAGIASLVASEDICIAQEGAAGSHVPLLRLFDGTGTRRINVFRQNAAGDKVYINHGSGNVLTAARLPLGTWAHVELRVVLNGAGADVVELRLDGTLMYSTSTATVGTSGLRTLQIGNDTKTQAHTTFVDNVELR